MEIYRLAVINDVIYGGSTMCPIGTVVVFKQPPSALVVGILVPSLGDMNLECKSMPRKRNFP